jgi:hypothetical protein
MWPDVFNKFVAEDRDQAQLESIPPAFWGLDPHQRLAATYTDELALNDKSAPAGQVPHHCHSSAKIKFPVLRQRNWTVGPSEAWLRGEAFRGWDGRSMADFFKRYNEAARAFIERLLRFAGGPCEELRALFEAVLAHPVAKLLVQRAVKGSGEALDKLAELLKTDEDLKKLKLGTL